MTRFACALVLSTMILAGSGLLHGQGVIFLVRHADRASSADDSLLSPAGEQRAECLARTLADAGITKVFATDVRRTQQTAQPVSREFHIETTIIAKSRTAELVSEIKQSDSKPVLVVAHADTLPAIVEQLGAGTIPKFADREYDRLLVIPVSQAQAGQAITLRYCSMPSDSASAQSMRSMH
jgi:broad specificity phosphatase PhoE